MKKTVFLAIFLLLPLLAGCMVGIVPPGTYPVSPGYAMYDPYYSSGYYNVGYYDGGSYYAPAYPARNCGPTPFEVVFGKGALRQPRGGRGGWR